MAATKVGGEVDSNCTRCKMVLAHTVLAIWGGEIKRVRCNTCMGEHAYRPLASGSSSATASSPSRASTSTRAPRGGATASRTTRPSAAERLTASYDALLVGKSRSSAKRYALDAGFALGELIEHPSFGLGVVTAVRGPDKIEVLFPSTTKVLMHNRGAKPSAAPGVDAKQPDVAL